MTIIEPTATPSDLVGRVKRLLLTPSTEWDRIDAEPTTLRGLYVGYVCILAAIPAIAGVIGGQLFGHGLFGISMKPSLISAIVGAVVTYGMTLLSVFLLALIIDALAPSFDGQKNRVQAFKVSAYTGTAGWTFGVLNIFPPLGIIVLLGSLYGLYLLYLGLPKLMKAPKEKAFGYTAVTILCAIVLFIVVGAISGAVAGMAMLGGAMSHANVGKMSGTVSVNGKEIDLSKVEAASKQLEAAAASANANGSSDVKLVSSDVLKSLLPGSIAGYSRTEVESNSGGAGGMQMAVVTGDYDKNGTSFRLAVTDLGAMAGMAAMASAINAQSSRETATGYEKVGKVDGRMVTEEWDREAKSGKYTVLVGDRFTVEASGNAASIDELKSAVASVNPGRLESLAK